MLAWRDRDNPLYMPTGPIDTVEMTFQESKRYDFEHPDAPGNWETLFTNHYGLGFAHLGAYNYRFISGAHHALHCVYTMTHDFSNPDHVAKPSHHFIHCLTYIRQIALCNADMTLEPGDFMMRNLTVDRTGVTRSCKDWKRLGEWLNDNFKEWVTFNGLSLDDLM